MQEQEVIETGLISKVKEFWIDGITLCRGNISSSRFRTMTNLNRGEF
ncbi:MAG: hypothetical protein HOA04_00395 [Euryarchaeota archaeon]|nr:hypothetical protein [Euryarchaeota archaeon]MBT7938065.1 hypothetical protein [Euryarchaeota archaeon]